MAKILYMGSLMSGFGHIVTLARMGACSTWGA